MSINDHRSSFTFRLLTKLASLRIRSLCRSTPEISVVDRCHLTSMFTSIVAAIIFLCAWSGAEAQPIARLGVLIPELDRAQSQALKGLNQELKRLGYQERKNLLIETRNGNGDRSALQPAAADLVARKTQVLFTTGTRAALAASAATKEIPIVFVHPGDPRAAGMIKDGSNTANNLCGVAGFANRMTEQRLALLKEIMPELRVIHVFFDSNNSYSKENFASAAAAAKKLGVQVAEHGVKSSDELKATFSSLKSEPATAIFQVPDDLVESEAEFVFATARQKKLPTMFNEESWAIAGAMAAYGPDYLDMGRRAAMLVDKLFKGQKPASLPIERANKFDLTVNYRTAHSIDFRLPPAILKKANKVIR